MFYIFLSCFFLLLIYTSYVINLFLDDITKYHTVSMKLNHNSSVQDNYINTYFFVWIARRALLLHEQSGHLPKTLRFVGLSNCSSLSIRPVFQQPMTRRFQWITDLENVQTRTAIEYPVYRGTSEHYMQYVVLHYLADYDNNVWQ